MGGGREGGREGRREGRREGGGSHDVNINVALGAFISRRKLWQNIAGNYPIQYAANHEGLLHFYINKDLR